MVHRIISISKKIFVLLLISVIMLICLELSLKVFMPNRFFWVGTTDRSVAPNVAVLGWAFKPNSTVKQLDPDTGKLYVSKINSAGWKDVEHSIENKNGNFRILLLGDSHTFSMVPIKDTYSRILEKMLNDSGMKTEVISMGYGGWGTDHELVALKNYGLAYKPDLVIVQFDTNDLTDNISINDFTKYKPFRFEVVSGQLICNSVPVTAMDQKPPYNSAIIYCFNIAKHNIKTKIKQILGRNDKCGVNNPIATWWAKHPINPTDRYFVYHSTDKGSQEIEYAWLVYEKIIEQMNSLSKSSGASLCIFNEVDDSVLAWDKTKHRVTQDASGNIGVLWGGVYYPMDHSRHVKRLKEICLRQSVLLIPNKRSYTRFANDPHPNADGNMRMAEDIYDFLVSNLNRTTQY
ncbi:MAG: SGNH/GDSL hydrolase family protein [Candidatus Omnitrophica bacterium]|nr:SGNH/GDSL hydrolase family protein [Candidatus Omnitrophota bacterium]MBU1870181.1 SGNH/GDSL hydrolase family protein [Candidatus Omnitrophota bacterium]